MGIFVYPHDCTDFSTTGLCGDLQPIEAYFEEEKNGISQIEMTLQYDELGKWKEAKVGRYIIAMVPVRVVPAIENDSYSTTIQKVKIKSGVSKVYVDKTCKKVMGVRNKADGSGYTFFEPSIELDPESSYVQQWVKQGIAAIQTEKTKVYVYQDDYEIIEQVEIPPALDGVESVTGTARLKPQFFIITSVEQTLEGMIVTAKHVFYELLANATTYKTENTVQGAAACRQVFDNLISADERFEIYSDCTDEQSGLDYDRVSPVQALLDPDEGICAKYGLSLIRDNYSIYALKNVGTDRGFVVEYGKNMLSVDCIENIDETYTRIIPFGKDKKGNAVYMDGQKWVDSERINDYPAPRVLVLDCTDTASEGKEMNLSQVKAELKRRAEEELANGIDKPNLEMTVDFLSLGDTEEYKQYRGLDKVYMFDRITVKDKVRGYNYTAEVVAVRHNLLTGMLESCTIGSLETASAARKIASWQVPTVDGGNIRLQSIVPGILGADAVATDNIQDNAVVSEKIIAGAVTAEKVDADAIQAKHLSADALNAVNAQLKTAHIGWAEIDELTAAIANIASGKIQNADIDFAHIKDLAADTAIITKGVGGELYISRLAVTEANMVSLSVGQLLVKGEDGGFYSLSVDESGNITTEKKQVGNDDVGNLSINAGEKLIEGSVTAATLNAKDIFADSAIIRQLIAANIDVDTLFAREATIAKLNAVDISGNEYLRLSVKKAVDDIEIGGRNILTKRPESTYRASNITITDYGFTIAPVNQDTYVAITTHEDIVKGEEYTLSMECSGFGEGEEWPFYIFGEWQNLFTLKNGKVIHTVQVPGDYGKLFTMDDYTRDKMPSGTVTVKNLKLERGNKATAWTPAPEDAEERIAKAEAELAVQAGEISMRATKEEVDNISVGGKNMLKNGDFSQGPSVGWTRCPTITPPGATDEGYGYMHAVRLLPDQQWILMQSVYLEANTDYTISMAARKADSVAENIPIAITLDYAYRRVETQPVKQESFYLNGRVWATFNTGSFSGKEEIYIRTNRPDLALRIDVTQIKLEKGNKPTDWTPAPEDPVQTLKNTAMTLNAEGIEMTTTGHFRLYANDGKNSRIKLGGDNSTANFSVDESGMLGAISGAFSDGLTVGNQPVWTRGNIIISSSQPTNVHDVLWIQPMQGVQQTKHSYQNTSQTHFTSGNAISYTLAPNSGDTLTAGGSYSYSLSLRMTLGMDTTTDRNYTVSAVLSTSAGSVTLAGQSVSLTGWKNIDLTLTGTSGVNLCAASGNITAAVTVSGGGGGNTYMYIPKNTSLILTSKNTAASSAGAQTCTIHYIQ